MFRIAYTVVPSMSLLEMVLLYNFEQYNNCMCMQCNSVGDSSVAVVHACSPPTSR